jgi:hypothetical protein
MIYMKYEDKSYDNSWYCVDAFIFLLLLIAQFRVFLISQNGGVVWSFVY